MLFILVFNSRRKHSYATVFPQSFLDSADTKSIANVSLSTSSTSLASGATGIVNSLCYGLSWQGIFCRYDVLGRDQKSVLRVAQSWSWVVVWQFEPQGLAHWRDMATERWTGNWSILNFLKILKDYFQDKLPDLSSFWSRMDLSNPCMTPIFELDAQCNVVLQGKIGQVFKFDFYLFVINSWKTQT